MAVDPTTWAVPAAILLVALLARRGGSAGAAPRRTHQLGRRPFAEVVRWPRPPARSVSADLQRLRSSLAGGASLHQALEDVARGTGAWAAPAAQVVARARAGQRLDRALDDWALAQSDPTVELLVDSMVIVSRTGASFQPAVAAVADVVHDQEALRHEVRALTSQARASALVLVATPLAFAVLLAVVDERIRGFFTGSWIGLACTVVGLSLDGIGAWWMHRVVVGVR